MTFERLDQWDKAEADFRMALKLCKPTLCLELPWLFARREKAQAYEALERQNWLYHYDPTAGISWTA